MANRNHFLRDFLFPIFYGRGHIKIGVHPSVLEHDQVSPQIRLRGAVRLSGERRILACLVEQVIHLLRVQCRPGLGHALHERWKPAAFHCLPNAAGIFPSRGGSIFGAKVLEKEEQLRLRRRSSAGFRGKIVDQFRPMARPVALHDESLAVGSNLVQLSVMFFREDIAHASLQIFVAHREIVDTPEKTQFFQRLLDFIIRNKESASGGKECSRLLVDTSASICRPTRVEPVNEINRGIGCVVKGSPISEIGPMTTLRTPRDSIGLVEIALVKPSLVLAWTWLGP
jgi:hypothetical protein